MKTKTKEEKMEIEFKRDRTRLRNLLKKYENHLITGISVQNKDYPLVNCLNIIRNAINRINQNMGSDSMQWINQNMIYEELQIDPRFDYKA